LLPIIKIIISIKAEKKSTKRCGNNGTKHPPPPTSHRPLILNNPLCQQKISVAHTRPWAGMAGGGALENQKGSQISSAALVARCFLSETTDAIVFRPTHFSPLFIVCPLLSGFPWPVLTKHML